MTTSTRPFTATSTKLAYAQAFTRTSVQDAPHAADEAPAHRRRWMLTRHR